MASNSRPRSSSSGTSRNRVATTGPSRPKVTAARQGGPLSGLPVPALAAGAIALLAVCCLLVLLVLSQLPVFTISSIEADDTEHITAESIAKLASVESGTTLLNVDAERIAENVRRNPWAGDVAISRVFPDKLCISVTERKIGALVLMGSGDVAWYLSEDGTWIEPASLSQEGEESVTDAAIRKADEVGCLLVTDVPSSVEPKAAESATDSCMQAVTDYLEGFSRDFRDEISSFSAPSTEAISITLDNGVEVSLGSATDVATKEQAITRILEENPNQVTFIDVRDVSSPSFRKFSYDAGSLSEGTGARDVSSAATTAATTSATVAATEGQDSDESSTDSEG